MTLIRRLLRLVRFEHTLFALPFAIMGAFLAADGWPTGKQLGLILMAMVGARTAAMGFNRIVDLPYDRLNPRTQQWELPSGKVTVPQAWALVTISAAVFVLAAGLLNRLALSLSPVALAIVLFYSYTKRFTVLTHLALGLALSVAPTGAWIAIKGSFALAPLVLSAAVVMWTAGFDIIYACQDYDFDRATGLRSIPARFGIARALLFSSALHVGMVLAVVAVGLLTARGAIYYAAAALTAAFLVYEHRIVSPGDLSRADTAFFTVNGIVSLLLMAATVADVLVLGR
jgi:4-hydroxybenzoate polyprenyltransferase